MGLKKYLFNLDPIAKPRMTRSDRWKKRPIVNHYYAFKDELKFQANMYDLQTLPDSIELLTFVIRMPDSWSEVKKVRYDKKPHKQTPDLDNCCKALFDCMCAQDNYIWQIKNLSKVWGRTGRILLEIEDIKT